MYGALIKVKGKYFIFGRSVVIDENRDVSLEVAYNDYQEQLKDFMDQFISFYDSNLTNLFSNNFIFLFSRDNASYTTLRIFYISFSSGNQMNMQMIN